MKTENEILLIVPPTRSYTQRLPLGLMYISSFLESKGEKNIIIDFKGISNDLAYNRIKEKIIQSKPGFVGITCVVSEVNIVHDMCEFIKKNSSETIIVVGGPHASICPENFVERGIKFDYLVLGEGEITVYELIQTLKEGGDINNVEGIGFMKAGKLVRNKPREMIQNLDELPFPAYDKVDMRYYCRPNVWSIRPIYISSFMIFTSRGCPYNCNFCAAHAVWGRKVRFMSPNRVVQHIEYVIKNFKIDALYFGDESFTVSKQRIYDIFNLLKSKKIKILFGCQTRVNLLDEELLKFLRNNGCLQIDFGIESGSDRMLKIMNKQTNIEMSEKIAKICRKIKLRHFANMLINVPGETLDDIEKSLRFVKDMGYSSVIWNVYCPVPGVNWERTLDMEDLDTFNKYPSKEAFELLERKYKFGDYRQSICMILAYLYSKTFHPKYFRFSLHPYYYRSIYQSISYIFDFRYIFQLVKSKRKMEYITNLFKQSFSM